MRPVARVSYVALFTVVTGGAAALCTGCGQNGESGDGGRDSFAADALADGTTAVDRASDFVDPADAAAPSDLSLAPDEGQPDLASPSADAGSVDLPSSAEAAVDAPRPIDGSAASDLAGSPGPDAPGTCGPDEFRSGAACLSQVVAVSAAENRTCAVLKSGHVACWGGTQFLSRPVEVPALDNARAIAVGGYWGPYNSGFACAITSDALIVCWGDFSAGALGDGSTVPPPPQRLTPRPVQLADGTPLRGVRAMSLGQNFGCAVTDTQVHCWGSDTSGQLTAVPAVADGVLQIPGVSPPEYYRPYAVPARGALVGPIGTGPSMVITSNGVDRVCGWGGNGSGHRYWPITGLANPDAVCADAADVTQIGGGFNGACLLHRNGDVSCWGYDLGINDLPGGKAPIGPASQMAAGAEHVCALQTDGKVFCWGAVLYGALGNGMTTAPTLVNGMPQQVMGLGADVIGIGSGVSANHTCAILHDGSLRCWGRNAEGQLGNNDAGAASAVAVAVTW
jgi:hypothetical protein